MLFKSVPLAQAFVEGFKRQLEADARLDGLSIDLLPPKGVWDLEGHVLLMFGNYECRGGSH